MAAVLDRTRVLVGADRLSSADALIAGKRCGLLTAASGVDSDGVPTYIRLHEDYCLTVLFAPEHGIHSVLQDGSWTGEYTDPETGVPVFDLPARGCPRIDEALSLCDVVLYDIQDVGARFYTYIYCLTYLMSECAKRNIPVVILDRPDPIGGAPEYTEGAILDETRFSSFVGRYAVPVRYSLTCGEFASYINAEKEIGCELHVVQCEGWKRRMFSSELALPWINPSPNIPSPDCALNYIGTCLIEATNASEGRGTTRPFDVVGAPYVDSRKLCEHMNSLRLDGVRFSRAFFRPMFGKHAGEACEGIQFNITDRRSYRPHTAGLHLLRALMEVPGFEIKENGLCLRYGRDSLIQPGGFDPEEILSAEKAGQTDFLRKVRNFLLYD